MKTVSKSRLTFLLTSFLFSISTYSQIPVYNSYPSASPTVFLDFDGQYLEGTSWNYNGPLTLGPGNMTTNQITEIFKRVSEDYRPFNVNITTDSSVYWAAPITQRMRVIFTITSSWYGAAGGVSYINSFTWGDNTPCFVFTALLGYNIKYVAEAASHEIGHTLGLNHQSSYDAYCNKTNEYNSGKGSGEIAWAPIMGVGYYRNFTLWHNGSNPWGCSSYQDDLSIITSNVGYRTDDYSGTITGTTTQVNFANNRFLIDGVIEQVTDKDVFKFTMPVRGFFHLDANPYSVSSGDNGSNLDVQIDLLNSSKKVLGTYNPELLLNATIDTALDAGTYFVSIQGSGNAYASDYASLGSYSLSADYTPATVLAVHRLQLQGISENGKHLLNWTIQADEAVTQQLLEVSYDGKNFESLKSLKADTRSYTDSPTDNAILYYRLNISFDNNKQYFSNIIALRNNITEPSILTNPVRSSVLINCPAAYNYIIVDYNGRSIAKGTLVQGSNTISTSNFSNGMYIIQFNNGQQQYAEKFMKQSNY